MEFLSSVFCLHCAPPVSGFISARIPGGKSARLDKEPLSKTRTTTRTRTKYIRDHWTEHSLLPVLLLLSLNLTHLTHAEPVIILDPYFYRTPLSESIGGSSKTVLAYYDETGGKVSPLPNPSRQPISELHTLAVTYAQSILKRTSPTILRDKHGVIVAIRIEDKDPAFSSILLTPGFAGRFANLLGKDCLVSVPNRQTVFLFPRLGSNLEEFSIPLRSIYHNSVWPVSTEIFEWQNGALRSIRDFEPDFGRARLRSSRKNVAGRKNGSPVYRTRRLRAADLSDVALTSQ
jgi:hypothetical protein